MDKKIILTGGGTTGHVSVNLALIPKLTEEGWSIDYIGSKDGIEQQLLSKVENVRYHAISTGKLRRYFDWNNMKDPFKVLKGVIQAYRLMRKIKPHVVFSKGGFVSVPVILAARMARVPSIIHESDLTPGLANKLAMPFASKICVTFPETLEFIDKRKGVYLGAVVRDALFKGEREKGLQFCGFHDNKPILLIMGGSSGARKINETIRKHLNILLEMFQIVHLCGRGNIDESLKQSGYKQFEYVNEELPDLLKMTTMVVSRAGSNAIFEFLALHKPMLLIPLPKAKSRGDQIENANSFKKAGYAKVLHEERMDSQLLDAIEQLYRQRFEYIDRMKAADALGGIDQLYNTIVKEAKEA
ncbi:MAG: undecaprenyldiphospho-muramoylpentapeptide beta-N-acetylglucosaminyltransferase [Tuberibacillus sp.]